MFVEQILHYFTNEVNQGLDIPLISRAKSKRHSNKKAILNHPLMIKIAKIIEDLKEET